MQEWQEKTRVGDFLLMSGCLLHPDAEDGPEKVKNEQLRNEASLNCASLRSRVHYVARRGLSRVEMNALRAPLTALSAPREDCRHFLLDGADAFIDGQLSLSTAQNRSMMRSLVDKQTRTGHPAGTRSSSPVMG